MRQAVRAIVIRDGALLVMRRNKFDDEYYTLIGGGIDKGESQIEALHRELAEETGVAVTNPRLVLVEELDPGSEHGPQYVYLCDYVSGEPALHAESEEALLNKGGQNIHTPMWLPLSELSTVPFLSPSLQQHLLDGIEHGWPEKPEHFQHHQV